MPHAVNSRPSPLSIRLTSTERAQSLEIYLTDYQRWVDDNAVADKYLRDQLAKPSVAEDAAIKPALTPAL